MVLLVAGSETTTNQLGNSMLQALRNPEVFCRLRSTPELVRPFIDESLRFDSPVQRVSRRTVTDVKILGQEIPKESYVIALLGAANRDPDRFKDPGLFDMDRNEGAHLAFGAGLHYCLGNQLSRVEAEIVWKKLLERFPDPEPSHSLESIRFRESFELRGPASLELKFNSPGV